MLSFPLLVQGRRSLLTQPPGHSSLQQSRHVTSRRCTLFPLLCSGQERNVAICHRSAVESPSFFSKHISPPSVLLSTLARGVRPLPLAAAGSSSAPPQPFWSRLCRSCRPLPQWATTTTGLASGRLFSIQLLSSTPKRCLRPSPTRCRCLLLGVPTGQKTIRSRPGAFEHPTGLFNELTE